MTPMKLGVIIPAAGASSRFGGRDKLNEDLGGRPLLHRTVELFVNHDAADVIIVAGPAPENGFDEFKLRHGDKLALLGVTLCPGGRDHRWQTVKNALAHVPPDCTHIAVHDAARPCASRQLIDRVVEAARKHDAVIPAIDVPDTLKRVSAAAAVDQDIDPLDALLGASPTTSKVRTVEATVSRENVVAVQTPQIFQADLLRRAYEQDDLSSTDDAGLVERLGAPVVVVEGEATNLKVTRPADIRVVMAILGLKPTRERAAHKKF